MPFFGFGKPKVVEPAKKVRPRKIDDPDYPKKRAEAMRYKYITTALMDETEKNPELKRLLIMETFGIKIPEKDNVAEQRARLQTVVADQAVREIEEDEGLRKKLARQQVNDLINLPGNSDDDEDEHDNGNGNSPIGQLLEELDNVELLKERLGGSNDKGLLKSLLTPETVTLLLQMLVSARGGQVPQLTPPGKTYVIMVDNQMTEVNEEEYRQLINNKQLKPIAQLAAPAPKPEPPKQDSPKLSDDKVPFVISLMGMEPLDAATQLMIEMEEGNEEAKAVWDVLKASTYEDIVKLIEPYRSEPTLKEVIDKVMSNKTWLDKVIQYVKETPDAGT